MNNAFGDHLLPLQPEAKVLKAREPVTLPQAARQGCLSYACKVLSSLPRGALHSVPCSTLAFKQGSIYFILLYAFCSLPCILCHFLGSLTWS